MQLVLDTHGLIVKVRNRSFYVIGKEARRLIGPERLTSIAVTADCIFSTAALRLAIERHIPVYLLGNTGQMEGKLWSPHFVGLASLRRAQALWLELGEPGPWVVRIASAKTRRQLELLEQVDASGEYRETIGKLLVRFDEHAEAPEVTDDMLRQTLFGLEGTAARQYWQAIADAVPADWRFEGRTRRPAQDPFNAALNYLYGMLYPAVEHAVFAAGLDPYMGILHAEEYDRPALAYDLIEPF
ncbi:MAG: CRISPR-associated endonuclease Cas1, partial [Saprospiraceae bacterium]|nr:CRISPR-associated endonuclease Cas1 [Saprospiraceae bacterium]